MPEWTVQMIIAVAGAFLIIVAIVDGGLVIKEIKIPPMSNSARIISGIFGVALIILAIFYLDKDRSGVGKAEATFTYPSQDSAISLKTQLRGTVNPVRLAKGSYWIVLCDDDGDCYPQNKILALGNGTWEYFLKLGPAWKNRPLNVWIVSASEQASSKLQGAIDGEGLKPLPDNVTKLATLKLNVH